MRKLGAALLFVTVVGALFAPVVAPHAPEAGSPGCSTPRRVRCMFASADGGWRAPFFHPWTRVSQLEQQYEEDRTRAVPIAWLREGHLAQSSADDEAPLLILGADSFGRDVFSRLLFGARTSLSLSIASAVAALCAGALIGSIAGFSGGAVDQVLMRLSDLVLLLPAVYVALALRAVHAAGAAASDGLFAPHCDLRGGRRAVHCPRRSRDRPERTRARLRRRGDVTGREPDPAAVPSPHAGDVGFMTVQLILLVPSFIVAEATLSYVGLGFPEPVVSWGTMLQDASNIRSIADFPWLLSPALAMFLVVLGLNLLLGERHHAGLPYHTQASRTSVSPSGMRRPGG